ncbi:excalibur calcium-binding domain-containing protein [Rhizobium rosettiformans]|nr:excalibur calcium-binding domain-containing protein [Rhizobium rosettiformans]
MLRMLIRQMSISRWSCSLILLLFAQAEPLAHAQTTAFEVAARSCKQVSSCEEAVILWCSGYRRADGDNDGIPCENVCSTVDQVNEIRRVIGC